MAVTHPMSSEYAREECKRGRLRCIVVEPDRFWKRSQCVGCVQHKVSCTLDRLSCRGVCSPECLVRLRTRISLLSSIKHIQSSGNHIRRINGNYS